MAFFVVRFGNVGKLLASRLPEKGVTMGGKQIGGYSLIMRSPPRLYSTQQVSPEIEEQDEELKRQILDSAMQYVNVKGWNLDAIKAGAMELELAEEVSNIFTEYDLVKHFISECNEDLENHLKENKLKLGEAVEWRLQKVVPYVPRFTEALAFATHPQNLPQSLELLQKLSDSIAHHALQDTSTDIAWYAKRAGVASIYVASELHLMQDTSPNFENTWKFINRRVQDFENLQKGSLSQLPGALPELASIGFTTLLNMLGRNKQR